MIAPFHLSIRINSDGKQMYASCRSITLTMGLIVMLKSSLKLTLNLQLNIKTRSITERMMQAKRVQEVNESSVIILLNSFMPLRKFNNGQKSMILQMLSQSKSSQRFITSLILMASISLDQFVIKVPADLATLSLSLKS
jgi:hypothetical protein